MTNVKRITNDEILKTGEAVLIFGLGISFVISHSDFVICEVICAASFETIPGQGFSISRFTEALSSLAA